MTWDFGDVADIDLIDDAGNLPWEDRSLMDYEIDHDGFDLTNNDDIKYLLSLI